MTRQELKQTILDKLGTDKGAVIEEEVLEQLAEAL